MKKIVSTLFVIMLFGITCFAQEKLGVTVKLKNGKSTECKLDNINADKVLCFVIGSDKKVQAVNFARSEVASISTGPDDSNKFKNDEEGYVLKNGRVIKGKVLPMKGANFVVRTERGTTEELSPTDVQYIQLAQAGSEQSDKYVRSEVVLPANGYWRDTGVQVQKGDRVWFRVGHDEYIQCSFQYRKVDAEGVEPFWVDNNRPLPDAKACALIGRVGNQGQPFRIGFNETPFVMQESGSLQIGVNDPDLRDNAGEFHVAVYKQVQ